MSVLKNNRYKHGEDLPTKILNLVRCNEDTRTLRPAEVNEVKGQSHPGGNVTRKHFWALEWSFPVDMKFQVYLY